MSEQYFCFDGEGLELHPTAKGAEAAAKEAIEAWRHYASEDGEWSDEAQSVCWGRVLGHAVFADDEGGTRCELRGMGQQETGE